MVIKIYIFLIVLLIVYNFLNFLFTLCGTPAIGIIAMLSVKLLTFISSSWDLQQRIRSAQCVAGRSFPLLKQDWNKVKASMGTLTIVIFSNFFFYLTGLFDLKFQNLPFFLVI